MNDRVIPMDLDRNSELPPSTPNDVFEHPPSTSSEEVEFPPSTPNYVFENPPSTSSEEVELPPSTPNYVFENPPSTSSVEVELPPSTSSDGFGSPLPDADVDGNQALISDDNNIDTDCENGKADDLDSPPHKCAKCCLLLIAVPASVKAAVVKASGGKCWLCNLYGVHIAHVIDKSDKILFEEYRRSGLLHLDSLHNIQNLMHLCAGCHSSFNARVPVWTFLPTNLSHFIDREIEFQQYRASAAARGISLQRPDPCDGKITNLVYGRYMIRDGYIAIHPFVDQPTKRWRGNPVASILRSVSILAGVQRLDPTTQGGIPDLVARNFHHLMYLYRKPAPRVMSPLSAAMSHTANFSAPDSDDEWPSTPPQTNATESRQAHPHKHVTRTRDVGILIRIRSNRTRY